jgi:predicted Zn-dependent protease
MNDTNTIQYYNGYLAAPYKVRIEVGDGRIHIFDSSYNNDNGKNIPFSQCRYVLIKDNAFVYLNNNATEYLVIPKSDEEYLNIINGIEQNKTGWYQKLLSQKWYSLVLLVAVLAACIYFITVNLVPAIALKFISPQQEIVLGDKIYNSFIEDESIDSTKTVVLQKFADDLHLSNVYPINVVVLKDSIINAFALPGGHLVVYSGIINHIGKPEELVALLSHEASHVNKRHSLKSIISHLTTSIAISLAVKDLNGLSKNIIENAHVLRELSYSRKLEKEADEEGMKLMVSNNINPAGMKWLMEDLKKSVQDIPSQISFLSNHPLTTERITDADNFIKKYLQLNIPVNSSLDSLWIELKSNQ